MTSKKPQRSKKAAVELTTDEAVRMLFPAKVIDHAKDRAVEADRVTLPRRPKKSISEQ